MTTTDLREWLKTAQERADKATKGPWGDYTPNARHSMTATVFSIELEGDELAQSCEVADGLTPKDAAFTAAARTEHPQMAAALLAVLKVCDQWEERGHSLRNTASRIQFDMDTHRELLDQADDLESNAQIIRRAITDHLKENDHE